MHRENDRSASLLDFLKEHYISQHEDDGDADADQQLPFKSFNSLAFQNIFLPATFSPVNKLVLSPIRKWAGYVVKDPSDNSSDIFHPPAVV